MCVFKLALPSILVGPKTADGITKAAISKAATPRQVKSYTERLQEMKLKQRYATPIIPRRHVPESGMTF